MQGQPPERSRRPCCTHTHTRAWLLRGPAAHRARRVTNTISWGWLALQAAGPLSVVSGTRCATRRVARALWHGPGGTGCPYPHAWLLSRCLHRPPGRIAYTFDSLALRLGPGSLPLPLLFKGGGWTEVVALLNAGTVRTMRNSRRDTLVLQRVEDAGRA